MFEYAILRWRAGDPIALTTSNIQRDLLWAAQGHRRSKAEDRVAWIMDLQTAATVFVHGYDLVSADAHHPLIAAQLHALAPDALLC